MNSFYKRLIIAGCMLVFSLALLSGRTLTVALDKSGDFSSISAAVKKVKAGDTILIKQGVYKEQVTIEVTGGQARPVIIKSYPGHKVVIDGEKKREHCLLLHNSSYVTLEGLHLINAAAHESIGALHVSGNSTFLTLSGLTIKDSLGCGIGLSGKKNLFGESRIEQILIEDCVIENSFFHGIIVYHNSYQVTIQNNIIAYSGWYNEKGWGDGILVCDWSKISKAKNPGYIYVKNNEIHHSKWQGIQTWNAQHVLIRGNRFYENGSSGIQVEDGTAFFVVEQNECYNNSLKDQTETGIWIDDSKRGVVRNNKVYGNEIGLLISKSSHVIARHNLIYRNNRNKIDVSGLMVVQYEGVRNSDSYIVHNTVYKNGRAGQEYHAGVSIGIWDDKVESVTLKNNIISSSLSGKELYVSCKNFTSEHNLIHNLKTEGFFYDNDFVSFADYRDLSGQDKASFSADPAFVDPAGDNFSLQAASPAVDKGAFLTFVVSSGSGTKITVDDARYFCNGFEVGDADTIVVGNNAPVNIISIDYENHVITLDKSISWKKNDGVSFVYQGKKPDIGALEYK